MTEKFLCGEGQTLAFWQAIINAMTLPPERKHTTLYFLHSLLLEMLSIISHYAGRTLDIETQ